MDAVIIAAGAGTRMRPLTERRPKPLLPVGETTLLEHTMELTAPVVDRFVLVVGYRGEQVREAVGDRFAGAPVEYVEQSEPLGTAHAIGCAEPAVEDRFLVINGDVLVEEALPRRLAETEGTAMAVRTVEDPRSYGVVDVDGERVVGLVEKPDDPPSNLINTGLYAFEPSVFEYVERTPESERGEYEITDTIELLLEDGVAVSAGEYEGTWLDVGRPWELLEANEAVLAELGESGSAGATTGETAADGVAAGEPPAGAGESTGASADDGPVRRIEGDVEDGADLHGDVVVEAGARVRAGAYVEGPVVIREGADVGPNAYVRGATVIGEGVRVGNAVEIKNSVLLADAAVGHLSYVGDSVLGRGVNFGAGTKVANLRHDDEPVAVRVKGERVSTGRRKFGVVVGDDAKTGINTSLNAGVTLGTDATTAPGETVLRDRGR